MAEPGAAAQVILPDSGPWGETPITAIIRRGA